MTYLTHLKKLCADATEGPWENEGDGIYQKWVRGEKVDYNKPVVGTEERGSSYQLWNYFVMEDKDGEFIATARTAVPFLLKMVEKMQEYAACRSCCYDRVNPPEYDIPEHVCECGLDALLAELDKGPEGE